MVILACLENKLLKKLPHFLTPNQVYTIPVIARKNIMTDIRIKLGSEQFTEEIIVVVTGSR